MFDIRMRVAACLMDPDRRSGMLKGFDFISSCRSDIYNTTYAKEVGFTKDVYEVMKGAYTCFLE